MKNLIGISGKIGSGKDTVGAIIQWLVYRDQVDKGFIQDPTSIYNDWTAFTVTNYHIGWDVKKFADKLKNEVCSLIGCTREQLEDQDFKNQPLSPDWQTPGKEMMTPRLMLQLKGTEGGRNLIHTNIWVNALFADYKPAYREPVEGFLRQGFGLVKIDNHNVQVEYTEENSTPVFPNWLITDMRFPNELEAIKSRGGISIRVKRNKSIVQDEYGNDLFFDKDNNLIQEHASETGLDNAEFDYVIDNNGTIDDLIYKVKDILIKEQIL